MRLKIRQLIDKPTPPPIIPTGRCAYCLAVKPLTEMGKTTSPLRCWDCREVRYICYRYKLSPARYRSIIERSKGKCAICEVEFSATVKASFDHCHATGKVRALLCRGCNIGLGCFSDNPTALLRAVAYLAKWA